MSEEEDARLGIELQLLEAMYPSQTQFDSRSRDFKFNDGSAALHLRLPARYPDEGFPDVLSATDQSKNDIRQRTKAGMQELQLTEGEEALDAIIACFQDIIFTDTTNDSQVLDNTEISNPSRSEESKTVIIWLHHLLATTKRKLALAPPQSSPPVSGVTKPGYPGVLLFSGPASAVSEHVNTLKAENWQAFQVRYEEAVLWEFAHGNSVVEVESMAEVAQAAEGGGKEGKQRKEEFLKAVGIK